MRRRRRAGRRRAAQPARRRRRSAPSAATRRRAAQAAAHDRPPVPRPTRPTSGWIVVVTEDRRVNTVIGKEWAVPPADPEPETDRDVRRIGLIRTGDALGALERRPPGDDLSAGVDLPVEREPSQVQRLIERRRQRVVEIEDAYLPRRHRVHRPDARVGVQERGADRLAAGVGQRLHAAVDSPDCGAGVRHREPRMQQHVGRARTEVDVGEAEGRDVRFTLWRRRRNRIPHRRTAARAGSDRYIEKLVSTARQQRQRAQQQPERSEGSFEPERSDGGFHERPPPSLHSMSRNRV